MTMLKQPRAVPVPGAALPVATDKAVRNTCLPLSMTPAFAALAAAAMVLQLLGFAGSD